MQTLCNIQNSCVCEITIIFIFDQLYFVVCQSKCASFKSLIELNGEY